MAFNNLAENAERLSRRIQESFQERTRDFTRSGQGSYLDANDLDKTVNLSKLLDSTSEREKLDGLKRIIAMISKNRNVSAYFAQVIKNVASPNLEIRKLVYIFLLRYANVEPDLALLSINTFQKDLADSNPLIRAMALRVLSGIPVASIGSIVAAAIRKSAADSSPYVRRTAALAIPKCYNLDTTHLPVLMQTLSTLLKDRSPLAIGSVVIAFNAICPDRLELLHPHYRRLCRMIVDADEWGQVQLLELLTRYARKMLSRPPSESAPDELSDANTEKTSHESHELDPDLELLLTSASPLLKSRNPAVVMAVSRTIYYIAPVKERQKFVLPLLRLLHSSQEVERVTLENLRVIAQASPEMLRPHIPRLYIRSSDRTQVKQVKMRILVALTTPDNAQDMLREFKDYVVDTDDKLVSDAGWAIGQCALKAPDVSSSCLSALTMLIRSSNAYHNTDAAVAAAVLALKSLHQHHTSATGTLNVVASLASHFDNITHPEARACILWMVGQYARASGQGTTPMPESLQAIEPWVPDILRKAVKFFTSDPSTVKLQTLTLAAKAFVLAPNHEQICLLARYVFSLARYDLDYDVRDRARFLSSLLTGVNGGVSGGSGSDEQEVDVQGGVILRAPQVIHVLFEGKVAPRDEDRWRLGVPDLGTASLITGVAMQDDYLRQLPDWPDEGTDSSLRDTQDDTPAPFYHQPSLKLQGFGAEAIGNRSRPASTLATPVVLTPGDTSPASSVPKPGFAKPHYMDLDKFFASDEEEESGSEEEEADEELEAEPQTKPAKVATTAAPNPISVAGGGPATMGGHKTPQSTQETDADDEYTDEESDEEDAFLRRG
ncbi:AP-3 complex subunit beta [Tulasnella sp. UAMH 9824]|nr:AP-3 complex subunit beta [Tulasnella sp. UAMH 9824]